ncbi:MAG: glycoside hydrolase family 44 protein [Cystobacter sp.]
MARPWLTGWMLLASLPGFAQTLPISISIDAGAQRHAISPFIYGVSYGTQEQLAGLNSPINRYGGNTATRYNWWLNAANRGADWYFQSLPYPDAAPGARVDAFIASTKASASQPALTIPMVGWTTKLGTQRARLTSYSISKYGPQTDSDRTSFPDSGNGIHSDGDHVDNDPHDANTPADPLFYKEWMSHLRSAWGPASSGGVRYFAMDNEPSLWHLNHRDVHPEGATMDEVRDRHLLYASMVKDAEPDALILGPEEWGWSGYFYSGYDQKYVNDRKDWTKWPDRDAHGGADYLPWLLSELRQHEQRTGRRLLDVFTVHYYPQGGEFSTNVTASMQARRNRSTRSLWDSAYVDESWIDDKVALIPRLKSWTQTYYPGTKVGITEYNWGAEAHISGALAQADVLGIFGREDLDYGIRWEAPAVGSPTFKAMQLYRNYDGRKSGFGDTSVACAVPNPDQLSAFAAERTSDGALTVMVINKATAGPTPVRLQLSQFNAGLTTQRWQLTSANTITRLEDTAVASGTVLTTVPAQSVTLFVVPRKAVVNQPPVARLTATPTTGTAPLVVVFNGSASTDPDGRILTHVWNFGDGQVGLGATATHTYTQVGTYTATLTVTDSGGISASNSVVISVVTLPPPIPNPTLSAPSNFYAKTEGTDVIARWKDNSTGEEGFIIERTVDAPPRNYLEIGRVGANQTLYVDPSPPVGEYIYRVRAFHGSSVSAYSNQDNADVD